MTRLASTRRARCRALPEAPTARVAAALLPWIALLAACAGSGSAEPDFLDPPRPAEPLDGAYEFDVEIPVYGSLGGYEIVHGSASFAGEAFQVQSTHGSCAGALEPDGPGRYRVECQGLSMELRWLGSRWGGRLEVQVVESEEEQICVSRDAQGGCAQVRTERRQRPVRRNAEFALYRPGEAR